jgi:hypothetical protein
MLHGAGCSSQTWLGQINLPHMGMIERFEEFDQSILAFIQKIDACQTPP